MKVEVAILGLPSQMVLMDCAHKATLNLNLAENQFFYSIPVGMSVVVLRLGFPLKRRFFVWGSF